MKSENWNFEISIILSLLNYSSKQLDSILSMLKKISSQAKTQVHYSKCSKYFEETPPHNNLHCLLIVFMNARKQRIVLWTKNDSNSFIEMSDSNPYNVEQWNDSSREENFRGRKGPELSWTLFFICLFLWLFAGNSFEKIIEEAAPLSVMRSARIVAVSRS